MTKPADIEVRNIGPDGQINVDRCQNIEAHVLENGGILITRKGVYIGGYRYEKDDGSVDVENLKKLAVWIAETVKYEESKKQ